MAITPCEREMEGGRGREGGREGGREEGRGRERKRERENSAQCLCRIRWTLPKQTQPFHFYIIMKGFKQMREEQETPIPHCPQPYLTVWLYFLQFFRPY